MSQKILNRQLLHKSDGSSENSFTATGNDLNAEEEKEKTVSPEGVKSIVRKMEEVSRYFRHIRTDFKSRVF